MGDTKRIALVGEPPAQAREVFGLHHGHADAVHALSARREEVLEGREADSQLAPDEFEVVLKRCKRVLKAPTGETIVQVLKESGVDVMTSCEEGIRGTCITTLLEGAPEHRDEHLTDDEKASNTLVAVCTSRAKAGRLVLDL
jgi:ferredoxin